MATIRIPVRALCAVGATLLLLAGCDKLASGGDAEWARAALERNDSLSIVAYDKSADTFTVKVKNSGELKVIRADEIVGSIPGVAEAQPIATPAATVATATPGELATPAPADGASDVAGPEEGSTPRYPLPQSAGTAVITDPATGHVLASNAPPDTAAPADAASDRKTLASGPGYSIKAGDGAPPPAVRLASRSSDIPSPVRGVALERRYEPMICQGQRLLHIDGRNMEFEGDAISAEDGCEIHITNSHIIAHGVGVFARAANVHIKNSVVEGDSGSVSASKGAQVYTQSSTFKGLSRRLDTASFHDLGGTVWN